MIKAGNLVRITTNSNGEKRLELNRELFDSMDDHQKDTFTKLYTEWFLSAREEYNENVGMDSEDYIRSLVEECYDSDEEFQKVFNTEHTREEFLEHYENGDFDEIPELKEMEKEYDKLYLDDVICNDFEYAPFLIATGYYGEAEQFIDIVKSGISRLWECGAPNTFLDEYYMFLTEEEDLLMSVTDENVEDYEEEWLAFAEKLVSKFPKIDIEKVYSWVVESVPFYDLEEVKVGYKLLSYEDTRKYLWVA